MAVGSHAVGCKVIANPHFWQKTTRVLKRGHFAVSQNYLGSRHFLFTEADSYPVTLCAAKRQNLPKTVEKSVRNI